MPAYAFSKPEVIVKTETFLWVYENEGGESTERTFLRGFICQSYAFILGFLLILAFPDS